MDEGEVVHCANPECEAQSYVKLRGTVPNRWNSQWIESQRRSFRVCSEACREATKEYYRNLSGQWVISPTMIDTRKRKQQ